MTHGARERQDRSHLRPKDPSQPDLVPEARVVAGDGKRGGVHPWAKRASSAHRRLCAPCSPTVSQRCRRTSRRGDLDNIMLSRRQVVKALGAAGGAPRRTASGEHRRPPNGDDRKGISVQALGIRHDPDVLTVDPCRSLPAGEQRDQTPVVGVSGPRGRRGLEVRRADPGRHSGTVSAHWLEKKNVTVIFGAVNNSTAFRLRGPSAFVQGTSATRGPLATVVTSSPTPRRQTSQPHRTTSLRIRTAATGSPIPAAAVSTRAS